jgi:asparagine synthase (glutamine-hydrolysing)
MCGIAGYKINHTVDQSILAAMINALYHRGPDSDGYYCSESYCAGIRRLCINDLLSGDQPLSNEDQSVVLFYNGEIYNYAKLREELEPKGICLQTNPDGEVIYHL